MQVPPLPALYSYYFYKLVEGPYEFCTFQNFWAQVLIASAFLYLLSLIPIVLVPFLHAVVKYLTKQLEGRRASLGLV